jgi:RNA polymerase sigma-70 factor (ECF subfamily)
VPWTPGANSAEAPASVEAFRRFYERSFATVWSYAVSRVGRQAAEDLVSETFAVAWRRRAAIPTDALPWLIRVARNLALESFRSAASERALETELRNRASLDPFVEPDIAEAVVARHQALIALATLSEHDRELLVLVAWHGLSPRQAASVLGCSRATFFVRLHRARRRLERALIPQTSAFLTDAPPHGLSHSEEVAR